MPDVTQYLTNAQVIEIAVEGPDGANRMFLCSGDLPYRFGAGSTQSNDLLTFFVGPTLTRREVIRASCAAGITGYQVSIPPNAPLQGSCYIRSSDADWDDEGGRVQVRLEVEGAGGMYIRGFHYHVIVLAERTQ